jgi:hypothetical protein
MEGFDSYEIVQSILCSAFLHPRFVTYQIPGSVVTHRNKDKHDIQGFVYWQPNSFPANIIGFCYKRFDFAWSSSVA